VIWANPSLPKNDDGSASMLEHITGILFRTLDVDNPALIPPEDPSHLSADSIHVITGTVDGEEIPASLVPYIWTPHMTLYKKSLEKNGNKDKDGEEKKEGEDKDEDGGENKGKVESEKNKNEKKKNICLAKDKRENKRTTTTKQEETKQNRKLQLEQILQEERQRYDRERQLPADVLSTDSDEDVLERKGMEKEEMDEEKTRYLF